MPLITSNQTCHKALKAFSWHEVMFQCLLFCQCTAAVCGDIWLYLHMMSCLHGYLSVVGCRLFAYGKPDTIAIPKPNYILPHKNPDWFYYSGTSLPRFSWKRGHWMGVCVWQCSMRWRSVGVNSHLSFSHDVPNLSPAQTVIMSSRRRPTTVL